MSIFFICIPDGFLVWNEYNFCCCITGKENFPGEFKLANKLFGQSINCLS